MSTRLVLLQLLLLGASLILVACTTSSVSAPASPATAAAISTPTAVPTPEPTVTPGPTATPELVVTRTGAHVLAANGFDLLVGHRVGLIAHRASVVDGQHLAVLIAEHRQVELAALFAPEHGLYGTDAAGALVVDGVDPITNTPIFSLYGANRAPSSDALAGLDVLVYDLQDVGTRFFTYTSTLGLAMQAAAQADIPLVVLDRPNPLGAATLQGPTLPVDMASFIGMYPVPSAYGLTSGELATMIKQQQLLPGLDQLSLQIVPLQHWTRDMRWHDTGLPWIAPSPNLPTADAALVYPGTVLFEATSISEGRGTDNPFQRIGAPWIDRAALAAQMNGLDLAGVEFEAVSFTPKSIPDASPSPRFQGQLLHGVSITVSDASLINGLEVGLHLLDAVLRQGEANAIAPTAIIDRPDIFDRLAGSVSVREALVAEKDIDQLMTSFASDHAAFSELAADSMLYE